MAIDEIPIEIKDASQGLAYWIGYKQSLYDRYPIREGEIVGEMLNLLSSKFNNNFRIDAEVMYKNLSKIKWDNKERADIIISEKEKDFSYQNNAKYIIEVKRKEAAFSEITKDFKKLYKLKKDNLHLKCFLLYVSVNERPRKYVNKKGNTLKIIYRNDKFKAQIRFVKKSLKQFYSYDKNNKKTLSTIEKANYVCLVEIVNK